MAHDAPPDLRAPEGSVPWTQPANAPADRAETSVERVGPQNLSLLAGGHDYSYYDYCTSDAIDPLWGRDTDRRAPFERPTLVSAAGASGTGTYCQERKRQYLETLFRGILLRLLMDAARTMSEAYGQSLALWRRTLAGEWGTSGSADAAGDPCAATADLKRILELLEVLGTQRRHVREALDLYTAPGGELRAASRATFLLQERARMQTERTELVREVDKNIHFALHALQSERDLLRSAATGSESHTRWHLLPKGTTADTRIAPQQHQTERLTLDARIRALEDRRQRLLERRDALSQDLGTVH